MLWCGFGFLVEWGGRRWEGGGRGGVVVCSLHMCCVCLEGHVVVEVDS